MRPPRRSQLITAEPLEPRRLLTRYVFVDAGATGSTHNGTSWATAYTNPLTALSAAVSGDVIRVAAGTYKPTNGASRTATFTLVNGVSLYGGYAGHLNPAFPDARDTSLYPTLLSGDIGTPNDNSDNVYHVVTGTNILGFNSVTVDGFTITGGNANSTSGTQYEGGGMFSSGSGLSINNCTFVANSALAGGATAGSASFGGCSFQSNSALPGTYGGGAIYVNGGSVYVADSRFYANAAATSGGAIFAASVGTSNVNIASCAFVGNSAAANGGTLYETAASPNLVNCTFAANAAASGNTLYNIASSSPTLTNCIVWDAGTTPIVNSSSTTAVTYSDLRVTYGGAGNVKKDPLFTRPPSPGTDAVWGTPDDDFGDLRPQITSPVIDAGNNAPLYATILNDLAGNARHVDVPSVPDTGSGTAPLIDMGAYEARGSATYYVDAAATGASDGSTWSNAFTDLQSALAAAVAGDRILVAAGTYKPTSGTDRNATFHLKDDVQLLGGYAGHASPANPDERNATLFPATLSGDIGTPNDPSDNSVHVVTGTGNFATALLDGFIITGGNANTGSGGGLFVNGGDPSVRNCTFTNNSAFEGGTIFISSGSTANVILNCTFSYNTATGPGFGGGAISFHTTSYASLFIGCSFVANSADVGGAVYVYGNNNEAFGTPPVTSIVNCTFTANTARSSTHGGAIANTSAGNGSTCNLTNSVCYADTGGELYGIFTVTYSDVQGGISGTGNLNLDPKFTRAPSKGADNLWGTADDDYGDLRPQLTSPAIDAGNSYAIPSPYPPFLSDVPNDLTGSPRRRDIAAITDTGLGSAPVIDMGAYEAGTTAAYSGTGPLYLRLSPDQSTLQLFAASTPTGTPTTYPARALISLTITTASANDTLTLDLSNGPLPSIIFNAGTGTDQLLLTGLPDGTDLTVLPGRLLIGTTAISTTSVESVTLNAPDSTTLTLNSLGISGSLAIAAGKHLTLRPSNLTIPTGGTLDLADNSLLLDYTGPSPIPTIRQYLHDHLIISSTATPNHSLGYGESATLGLPNADSTALLIKYTLTGDANLDGRLNADDFALLDRGRAKSLSTWTFGDFNYDAQVTDADATLLNTAFASPPAPAPAPPIVAAAPVVVAAPAVTPAPVVPTPAATPKLTPTKKKATPKPTPAKKTPVKKKPKPAPAPKLPARAIQMAMSIYLRLLRLR